MKIFFALNTNDWNSCSGILLATTIVLLGATIHFALFDAFVLRYQETVLQRLELAFDLICHLFFPVFFGYIGWAMFPGIWLVIRGVGIAPARLVICLIVAFASLLVEIYWARNNQPNYSLSEIPS